MNRQLFIAAVLLPGAMMLSGCGSKTGSIPAGTLPAVKVQTQIAESKTREATEDEVGTVRAKLHAVIEAKVSGKLAQMLVVPGQTVTSGQLLATIDAREMQAQYDQTAALRQQAESDWKRAQDLFRQKILSQSEFDSAQSKFNVADAAANEAETMLGYTKISAPFDGVITRKDADVGDLAAPGKALLEMEDATHLRLEADVPEALVDNIKLGDPLLVRIDALETNLAGTVSEIAPSADTGSRTFVVKLDLPSVAGMHAGQFGRVAIPVGQISAMRVPATAIIQRGQLELLFVVIKDHAEMRIIKTGERVGDEVEVISGLDPGEVVVISDIADLTDGQPVLSQP